MSGLANTNSGRSKNSYLWFIAFAIAGLIAATGLSHYLTPKEIVPWRTDFDAAQAESQQSGKPVMLYFTAEWCGPCQSMKRTTWADEKVEQALRAFVPTRVDIDVSPQLAMQYGVESIPYMVVLNEDGSVRRSWKNGYVDAGDFVAWLE